MNRGDSGLLSLFRAIATGDRAAATRFLDEEKLLASAALRTGATRQNATEYFLDEIAHYVYAGDTALHVAAAAHDPVLCAMLLDRGASVSARNRRGAEPLHYAADGNPDHPRWNPDDQARVIGLLIERGADANAVDKSGVAPLHRAVRTRCASAVEALLGNGADVNRPNGSGSTPLLLARQNTGRGQSGSPAAREQQKRIIAHLLRCGAHP